MQAKAKVEIFKPRTFESPEIRRKPTLSVACGGCQHGIDVLFQEKTMGEKWQEKDNIKEIMEEKCFSQGCEP